MRSVLALSLSLLTLTSLSCRKQAPPVEALPARTPVVVAQQAPAPAPAPVVRGPVELASIYYDFDRSDIRADQLPPMRRNAAAMNDDSSLRIRIEGNCDERGTTDYNLALGERRARAARDWLVAQGIAPSRITTVSYGEERPLDSGHNEAAWARNRRSEFRITSAREPIAER